MEKSNTLIVVGVLAVVGLGAYYVYSKQKEAAIVAQGNRTAGGSSGNQSNQNTKDIIDSGTNALSTLAGLFGF